MTQETCPHGRKREFTDADLRDDLEAGLKPKQIAAKYEVSPQAVYKRINQLELTTTAAAVAPVESQQFVNRQLDAMAELLECIGKMKQLQAAYDEFLRDARDPAKFDIGPRGHEIMVTYWDIDEEGNSVKAKASLQKLLNEVNNRYSVISDQVRGADPRVEFRNCIAEIRQIVGQAVELARLLADAQAMQRLRDALLSEIAKVSPDVAEKVASAVRRSLILHSVAAGPEALSAS